MVIHIICTKYRKLLPGTSSAYNLLYYPTGTIHFSGIKSILRVILLLHYNLSQCQIASRSVQPFKRERVTNIHPFSQTFTFIILSRILDRDTEIRLQTFLKVTRIARPPVCQSMLGYHNSDLIKIIQFVRIVAYYNIKYYLISYILCCNNGPINNSYS